MDKGDNGKLNTSLYSKSLEGALYSRNRHLKFFQKYPIAISHRFMSIAKFLWSLLSCHLLVSEYA